MGTGARPAAGGGVSDETGRPVLQYARTRSGGTDIAQLGGASKLVVVFGALLVIASAAYGAFLLGWAFVGLDPRAARLVDAEKAFTDLPEARSRHRILAAFLATGFCGAFTTYSSLAREFLPLVRTGAWLEGASWLIGLLAIGLVALVAGIRTGRRFRD